MNELCGVQALMLSIRILIIVFRFIVKTDSRWTTPFNVRSLTSQVPN
jgi:hypothetical protein